jgi:signal transduction histidine kinase
MGMNERAVSLGGIFEIRRKNGSGTVVKLSFPIQNT